MKNNPKLLKSDARIITIHEDSADQRLDNFLFNKLKNVPKSRIYKMIRGGEVRVNKKRIKPLYKLQFEDQVRIPPFWAEATTTKRPSDDLIEMLLGQIIFEDDKILVINKPSGIASHSGSGIDFGVIEILRVSRDYFKSLELVHRLDRDTSGCLILAKNKKVLRELHHLIKDGEIFKKYVLLVRGKWEGGEQVVDLPLYKNRLESGERMVKVSDAGKESITIFRPLKIGKRASLIEAELKTGRTHQIRVHAASIGYPIAGDDKYGDREFNKKMRGFGLDRMFLHAESVSFNWSGAKQIKLHAPLEIQLNGF